MTICLSTQGATRAFGQRTEAPPAPGGRRLRPLPAQLAYALRNEEGCSLRRLVLERLYDKLTDAEKRLCNAEWHRTAAV